MNLLSVQRPPSDATGPLYRPPGPTQAAKDTSGLRRTNITSETERLLARMDDIRSMLRDSKSLDVVEMLLQALADCEQRLAWAEGESAVTEPASPQLHAQAHAGTPPATHQSQTDGTAPPARS